MILFDEKELKDKNNDYFCNYSIYFIGKIITEVIEEFLRSVKH